MPLPSEADAAVWRHWFEVSGQSEVSQDLAGLYTGIQDELNRRNPTCWISGHCCRFDSYGHRLFVSGFETAWMVRYLEKPQRDIWLAEESVGRDGCVFQRQGLCSVHAVRPLGCRLFFCDPQTDGWLNQVHEDFLGRLRRLHDKWRLEYAYMEWRSALSQARAVLGNVWE